MIQVKHTPGPWILGSEHWDENKRRLFPEVEVPIQTYILKEPKGPIIAKACGYLTKKLEAEANARLIAAAPELLEACQKALAVLKELADAGRYPESLLANNGGEGFGFLTNAIEKATTKQPSSSSQS
jgi:hypothetical protein